jgi:hypothetical protein
MGGWKLRLGMQVFKAQQVGHREVANFSPRLAREGAEIEPPSSAFAALQQSQRYLRQNLNISDVALQQLAV